MAENPGLVWTLFTALTENSTQTCVQAQLNPVPIVIKDSFCFLLLALLYSVFADLIRFFQHGNFVSYRFVPVVLVNPEGKREAVSNNSNKFQQVLELSHWVMTSSLNQSLQPRGWNALIGLAWVMYLYPIRTRCTGNGGTFNLQR